MIIYVHKRDMDVLVNMKSKKYKRLTAEDGFRMLAFGDVSDALRLLNDDNITESELKKLDLMNVESIKRSDKGGVEIKFFDRNKALQMLAGMSTSDDEKNGIEKLYQAINGDGGD